MKAFKPSSVLLTPWLQVRYDFVLDNSGEVCHSVLVDLVSNSTDSYLEGYLTALTLEKIPPTLWGCGKWVKTNL